MLHDKIEELGLPAYSNEIINKSSFIYYILQIKFLIKFCKKHKIDFVWSNLQHTNFISVFAQFFIKSKIICFRHHFMFHKGIKDFTLKVSKMERFFDIIINLLAKKIVVPSSGVYNGMKKYEFVNMKKVSIIPYIYDFSKYEYPNVKNINEIKKTYPAKLTLLMCARLIPFKRHQLVFELVNDLIKEGLDLKMFVLDEGSEKENLKNYIKKNNLTNNIIMIGFKKNFMEYMAASEILIHPSLTEASNNVVKEVGLMEKAVIVCEEVGDFDDYIEDKINGYLIPRENPKSKITFIIKDLYNNPEKINIIGKELKRTIISQFDSSEKTINQYLTLFYKYE